MNLNTTFMKVKLERKNDRFHFEAVGPNGFPVQIDSKGDEEVKGASPMELLLMAVGGCNAIDIVSILKKQRQPIESYRVEVEGQREEMKQAKPFRNIHVKVMLNGNIDPEKAKRAASLSFEKYCSVSMTLEGSVKVTYSVFVNGQVV